MTQLTATPKAEITKTELIASIAVMSALIAVLTALSVRISTLTVFNAGLLGVYIVSILFGRNIGMFSAGLGSAVAEIYLMSVRGDPILFLFGLIAARVPAAGLIGTFRKSFPVYGMVAGACLQTAIFLAIDIPIFGLGIAASLVWSLPFNILLVIPAHLIIKGVRAKLRKDFLY